MIDPTLQNRKVYIPQMSIEASTLFASAFRSVGIEAEVCPDSDEETLQIGGRLTSGDECYPQKITLGDFYKLLLDKRINSDQIAFFLPTTGGPCRFGQYAPYLKKVLRDTGYPQIPVITPSSHTGYKELGEKAVDFQRIAWRATICGDILRKLLLKIRPYEVTPGSTGQVHTDALRYIADIIGKPDRTHRKKMQEILRGMEEIRDWFRSIPVQPDDNKLFIGVVGEIFCRLEGFANNHLIRAVERNGGEVWLANVAEWVTYTNFMHASRLRTRKQRFSKDMLRVTMKSVIQHRDEKQLYSLFQDDFRGYEEAQDVGTILKKAQPYLPYRGALGEMVLSVGTSLHFYEKGIDGIIDISPFTCMNGVVTEALYPRMSKDLNNLPMRVFYFDDAETDLDRDISIFLDLARTFRKKKPYQRKSSIPFTA